MQIALQSLAQRTAFLGACLVVSALYLSLCAREFLAFHFSQKPDLASFYRAAALEPENAIYPYLLGRYYLLARQEPETAARFFSSAVALDPHRARYWFDLATAYQLLADRTHQQHALQQAIFADPFTPDVAWEAANLFWVEGNTNKALQEFRIVLENDPSLSSQALERCWRIEPNVDALMKDVLPHTADVYVALLEFLISRNRAADAANAWSHLAQLQQSVDQRYVFDYVRYLLGQRDVEQARLVWQQAASLSNLSAYQPSTQNLIVNGDFSLPVLNAGFDWLYEERPGVSLSLDPTAAISGNQSLAITFDSRGVDDPGIWQFIPVESNTSYEFSAYFKAEDLQGAGGPRLVIEDCYSANGYFTSEELKDADYWKLIRGTFRTGPDTRLLLLRLRHVPAEAAIRGRLWLDGFRLVKEQQEPGQ